MQKFAHVEPLSYHTKSYLLHWYRYLINRICSLTGYGGMNYGYPPQGQATQGAGGPYGGYSAGMPGPQIFQVGVC